MKQGGRVGVERRTALIRKTLRVLSFLVFLVALAAPAIAQVSAPAFVNVGPGSNQLYWINPNQFQANWGPSNFGASPTTADHYAYGINQDPAGPGALTTGPSAVSPPTSVTISPLPAGTLASGQTYYFWVQAINPAVGQSPAVRSSPFVADFGPAASISSSASPISTKATFTLSWSATPVAGIAIDHYDVSYRINGGPLRPWLSRTSLTSASFTGSNGAAYSFQVTATDIAGATGAASNPVSVTVNVLGATLSLTTTPSSLSFGGTDTLETLSLDIGARSGSVNVTSIMESRVYSSWPREDGGWESLPLSLPSGTDQTINRSVMLSVLQRSKALGGGQSGSFDLILTVRGKDAQQNDVQSSVTIPSAVLSAPPSTLTLNGVSVEVPASPYNLGDTVKNARVHITASGTGTVIGQVLVDGSTSWSGTPAFSVNVTGNTVFDVLGNLPTSVAGSHTVTVQVSSPSVMSGQTIYSVSSNPPAFPPSSLDLIKGVAQLTGLTGTASAVSGAGYTDYTFTGSAKLTLLSLANLDVPGFTVTSLVVRMFDNLDPPQIIGGSAQIDAGSGTITDFGGLLKIKKVSFDFGKSSGHLNVDAAVVVPSESQELFTAKDMVLDASGISDIHISLDQAHALSFTLFGMTFSIHDVNGGSTDDTKAIAFGKADGGKGYYIGISGGISMDEKQGVNTSSKDLVSFSNKDLRFYTDGSIDGTIKLSQPFELIPKSLFFDTVGITAESNKLGMSLSGTLKNLPAPLDKTGDIPVSFKIDSTGNGSLSVAAINKLKSGHTLPDKSDSTAWDFGLALLNLTYLSLDLSMTNGTLDLDHSQVSLAADVYLKLSQQGGGSPSDDNRRISFGDLDNGGKLQNGIIFDFSGNITWSVPAHTEILKDKKLSLGPVDLAFDSVSIDANPFGLVITGSIGVSLEGISGGINFANLKVGLDGTISDIGTAVSQGGGGKLSVLDAVSIEVDSVGWSNTPTSISLDENTSTGSGENMTPNKSAGTINVQSYFSMKGASITLGSGSDSIMSGGFDELTVYTLTPKDGGGTGFVVRNAKLSVSDALDVSADMEYSPSPVSFQFAGSIDLPSAGINAAAVGKVGTLNGKPSFGLFVIAELGPGVPIGPGVFLDELGGGFFVNPSDDDIALVRKIANFKRPELSDQIAARRPGGSANSQSFALMVLAGLSVAEKDLISGRAMVTITSSYFNLDAEVKILDGIADGKVYLAVSWNPAYAEGKITAEMGFPSPDDAIVSGTGDLDFYFYPGVWGIDGNMQVKVIGINIAQGELFVGTPGFMVNATVGAGIDLGIVSGSVSLEGMFWFYEPNSTLGAYAKVDLKGSFLAGLFSAEAGLEGCLIVSPNFLVYAVGSLSVDVLGVTVFDGSLWFAVNGNGLDGGTGRNSQYDALIQQAKDMANSLKAAKDALNASLEAAKLQLAQLTDEQAALAGLVLTEQQKAVFGNLPVDVAFDQYESSNWGGMPEPFVTIHGVLFGPQAKALVQARSQLLQTKSQLDGLLADLETLRKDVSKRLADYQDILVEPLPSIKDIGTLGNPFQGMLQKTVTVGGKTKTVKAGFALDPGKADSQKTTLSTTRENFAQYQEAFIEAAGAIDARLQALDEILFQGTANLTALNQRFAEIHSELSKFTDDFVQFQGQSIAYATGGQQTVEGLESSVQGALDSKANALGTGDLTNWNNKRIQLIQQLVQAGDPKAAPYAPDTSVSQKALFDVTGYELWFHMPDAGFAASVDASQKSMPDLIKSFSKSSATLLKNWGNSTDLTDQVFQRKADLYGVLYEIYDQLAYYGSGNIGVASDGNAAGFKGISSLGLSFRASAVSKAVNGKARPFPQGVLPTAPTFGTNRPLANPGPIQKNMINPGPINKGGVNPGPIQKNTVSPGPISKGPGLADPVGMEFVDLPSIGAGFSLSTSSVQLKEVPQGMPSKGAFDRSVISVPLTIPKPVAWVPVTTYFSAKRSEIAPYLVIPTVSVMTGTASSSSELEALLHATFNATHPVGVVEYEYRIEPISTGAGAGADSLYSSFFHVAARSALPTGIVNKSFTPKVSVSLAPVSSSLFKSSPSASMSGKQVSISTALGSKGGGAQAVMPLGSLKALILSTTPWLSVGGGKDLNFLFIPQTQDPGTYALFIKVRGAGGKTIIRQGRFKVAYAAPGQKIPVSSGMDISDNTPPTTPVVTLSGAATSDKQTLYAKWSADDQYSGIQGYQYAVEEYTDQTAKLGTGAVAGSPQGSPGDKGKMTNVVLSKEPTTTTTAQYFQSGPFVSAQEAASHKWVDAQGRTEANIRGLSLEQGKRYVVWVMATNGVGRASIGRSDPIIVDAIPPVAPQITAFQQTSADGHANSLTFTFTPGSDDVSGISGHQFAVGTSDKDQKIWPWTTAQGTSATIVNLPLSKGQQVTLQVQAVSGAGLTSTATKSFTITYPGTKPPVPPTVLTDPQNFTSTTTQLTMTWSPASDPDSGIVAYDYAVGTSPGAADVLAWTPGAAVFTPYVLGQGPQAPQGSQTMKAAASVSLKDKGTYYALVRATNGAGITSVGASAAIVVDLSTPDVTLSGKTESPGTDRLAVDITAKDPISGVAKYRAKVWQMKGPVSRADEREAIAVPVMGWSSQGTFQGTVQSRGMQVAVPQLGQAWYTTDWRPITNAAPPTSTDIQVVITGFPAPGLQIGSYYRVTVEVQSGAGVSAESNAIVIKVVAAQPNYRFAPRFNFKK
ncbi:MAG TPA: fibronectin type III domain-containing protein [Spirochaetia bacterium]|nr:fibronectin type III domain-containing protein [Spirochaetia bacterium]